MSVLERSTGPGTGRMTLEDIEREEIKDYYFKLYNPTVVMSMSMRRSVENNFKRMFRNGTIYDSLKKIMEQNDLSRFKPEIVNFALFINSPKSALSELKKKME